MYIYMYEYGTVLLKYSYSTSFLRHTGVRRSVLINVFNLHYSIVSKIEGFNIKTADGYASMMSDFELIVGLKYLKALHLNDSQSTLLTIVLRSKITWWLIQFRS